MNKHTVIMIMLTAQMATAYAADLNVFSSGEVADPSAVNANFDTLMRLARNQQHQGSFYRVNCSNDNNALLDAVSQGETLIEVEAGPCLANMGTIGEDVPIIGDLYLKGMGAAKPLVYSTDDDAGLQYLGGKNGSVVIENIVFEGAIVSIDSAASFTAIDSEIRCQDDKTQAKLRGYQIGIYLNGGTGALRESSVSNCSTQALLLDSGANLNATDSTIAVPPRTADFQNPIGVSLRSSSSATIDRTTVGGTGDTRQFELPIYAEFAEVTVRDSVVKGTVLLDRNASMMVRGMDYQWPNSTETNVILVQNDSSFFAVDTAFTRTTITNWFTNVLDTSSRIFLSSNSSLTHSNLTLKAGREISLQGDFVGSNLNASVTAGGVIRINSVSNQFNSPNLGLNSIMHLENPAAGPSFEGVCGEGTPKALFWGSDPSTQTGVLCVPD